MATLSIQVCNLAGLEVTFAACEVGGDQFVTTGRTWIHIVNADASPHTVTVAGIGSCSRGESHDKAVVVPAGEERVIGPFKKDWFQDGTGYVQLTYDAITSLTIAAVELDGDGV